MTYRKPLLTPLGSATDAIQSDQVKIVQRVQDNIKDPTSLGSSAAYEADE